MTAGPRCCRYHDRTVRSLFNKIQRIGLLRREHHLLIPHILQIVDHIIPKTTIKQHRLLTHHPKRIPQIVYVIVFDVITIDKDLPL